jgi:hypothetical protein
MITQKPAEELGQLLAKVEQALTNAPRPTKSLIVRTMSELGQCSSGSTGFEKSFLKALKAKQVPLTPKFAALMGEVAPAGRTAASAPSPETVKTPEMLPLLRFNLKAISILKIDGRGNGLASLIGGGEMSIGKLDESALRSSCNLIEFNV